MQVEYVTWVCFTSRWATKQQRYLTVSYRLLRQIIIDNQRRATGITIELTYCSTRERSIELKWSRVSSRSSYDSSVCHSTIIFQCFHNTGDSRCFLTDSNIYT